MSRILIIDDNNVDRLILKKVLTTQGHETFEATTGEEGVEQVRQESFDLVLMDLIMPGISGVEALLQEDGAPASAGHSCDGGRRDRGRYRGHAERRARLRHQASRAEQPTNSDKRRSGSLSNAWPYRDT